MTEGDARHGSGERRPRRRRRARPAARLAATRWSSTSTSTSCCASSRTASSTHADLDRRARRVHERKLAAVVHETVAGSCSAAPRDTRPAAPSPCSTPACPRSPTPPSAAFLGREKAKLTRSDGDRPRVALVVDGIGGMHGVTHTIQQIRARGVRGFDVEVIGTDADVDRRLSAVAEIDIPFYPGLEIGVPTVPAIVEALSEGRYDIVHVCSPGPAGIAAWLLARVLELPRVGSYHTELGAYAALRTGQPQFEALANWALGRFYGACDVVLSPSPASDAAPGRAGDRSRADPPLGSRRRPTPLRSRRSARTDCCRASSTCCTPGRLSSEKGVELLADAFLEAHRRDPRLHLVLAGGGPEEGLAARAPWRPGHVPGLADRGDALARAYASADAFLFASTTETFGQVDPRGPGQRPPGGRRRPRRPGLPDRIRGDRAARARQRSVPSQTPWCH